MPLYRATIKKTGIVHGIRFEKGMSVEFASIKGCSPLSNGGREAVDAFMRMYGVDISKIASVAYIDVVKIG